MYSTPILSLIDELGGLVEDLIGAVALSRGNRDLVEQVFRANKL